MLELKFVGYQYFKDTLMNIDSPKNNDNRFTERFGDYGGKYVPETLIPENWYSSDLFEKRRFSSHWCS